MSFLHEPLFEPVARNLRFQKGIKEISRKKPIIMVDLGCGPKIRFYHFAKIHGIQFKKYIGIDPLLDFNLLQQYKKDKIVQLKKNQLNKKISLPSASVDYIVAFASIEHFNSPIQILNDASRILKKGGKIILTTPAFGSKLLLEILSCLHLVSQREIKEHKQYFDKQLLTNLISKENRRRVQIYHEYFYPWQNNLFIVEKK